jgi:hypothetical protein
MGYITGQADGRAVIGVAVPEVQAAILLTGGFEVGRHAGLCIEHVVVEVQQRGAGPVALPAGPYAQEREVVVRDSGGVAVVQRGVEGGEPRGPGRGRGQELFGVAVGRILRLLAYGYP